jgi:amidase
MLVMRLFHGFLGLCIKNASISSYVTKKFSMLTAQVLRASQDQYYTADGGEDIRRDIEAGGEPYIPHVEALVNKGKPISVYAYWQLNKQKLAAQKRFLDQWNSTTSPVSGKRIDILLAPVMPHSAVPHRKCRWVGYTKIFNVVDYPSVVLPAGEVSKKLDAGAAEAMASYIPRNPLDEWNQGVFDLDTMDGMPIGVQVVARRLEEETALGAAKVVDGVLKTLMQVFS